MRAEYPSSPLPTHYGYNQLAIILEKGGSYSEAMTYANVHGPLGGQVVGRSVLPVALSDSVRRLGQ